MDSVYVVIPAYNEATVLAGVLRDVLSVVSPHHVIVVNDGSADETGTIARDAGVRVVTHRINRGLGAALKTGLILAKRLGAECAVTFDADGQHQAADIAKISAPVLTGDADMVIGSRFLKTQDMPQIRRVFNWIGNLVTWGLHGIWVSDSQSGLRAFSKTALDQMQISANHMGISSEFVHEMHRLQLPITEISIAPVYTEYSMSKGQSLAVGVKQFFTMFVRKFK